MMTLRGSLSISIFCHILIFGCALAFAQYAGMAFLPRLDAVQVSLIAPASLKTAAVTARNREQSSPVRENEAVEQHQPVLPSNEREEQPDSQQADATVAAADAGQSQPGLDAGQAGDARSRLVATEYLGLFEAIEKVKKYPRLARERGMEGLVRLRFKLNPSGSVEKIEVVKSSGYEILDSASISAVYRAAPMPYVNGWVDMPMKYVLK